MMQRPEIKIALLFIILTLAGTLAFVQYRERGTRSMRNELFAKNAEKTRILTVGTGLQALKKNFPSRLDVPLFIEELYLCAKSAGVKNHEVTSLPGKETPATGQKPGTEKRPVRVMMCQLKITFEGDYRSSAEYLRQIQNIGRFKRIIDIEMKPDKETIRTNITVEIVSFGKEDAE